MPSSHGLVPSICRSRPMRGRMSSSFRSEVSITISSLQDNHGAQNDPITTTASSSNDEYGSDRLPPLALGLSEPNPSSKISRSRHSNRLRSKSPASTGYSLPNKAHNRFHYNCCDQGKGPSQEDVKAKSLDNIARRRRARINYRTTTPEPDPLSRNALIGNGGSGPYRRNSSTMMLRDQVSTYLNEHPDFLEKYVLNHVSKETVGDWWSKLKSKSNGSKGQPLRRVSINFLEEITDKLRTQEDKVTKENLLFELTSNVAKVIGAEKFHVYCVNEETQELRRYGIDNDLNGSESVQKIGSGTTMAAHVAKTHQTLRGTTSLSDPRFPHGIQDFDEDYHVLVVPVRDLDYDQSVMAVIEFVREASEAGFEASDEDIVESYLAWGKIALSHGDICSNSVKQRKLQSFLLTVVKSIFTEMISMDSLIIKIMNFAQHLVAADRASLFLVDSKTNQLYARIFDIHKQDSSDALDTLDHSTNKDDNDIAREIRFPVGVGIAGYVAETGETLCVTEAYNDPRFNKSIDEQTGYHTRNILCMPISIRGQVIGVVQMVNKMDGNFTKEDEESFRFFSIYCGLALHHAKLYDKIRRSEQKYKVALEVLSYHNGSSALEVETIIQEPIPLQDPLISSFTFYALNMDDMEKVRKALFMFIDLFGLERFEYETLVRFIITVKKNYRQVAYHNWAHGFHVANSIYSILKASTGVFKPLECLAMFIGAICHDLDHRGFNNKFMIDVGSPLAAIYSTSTMEHHHFNMTVNILNQENHNIFAKLNPDEYKQVLGNIKHCILATDLALFFPNKARLTNILKDDAFSWDLPDHRMIVEALVMTASDLCSSSKPWDLQLATVTVIYEEFYSQHPLQGDREKREGRVPVPIMNRKYEDQQSLHQVGFIGGICLPCYDLLVKVLPNTAPMQEQCTYNLNVWKSKAEERKNQLEAKEENPEENKEKVEESTKEE
ncbi:probable 3',5'-cyclic phosphodiesterase pde-5 isoform X3 [Tigriopus californicus]|uniref:probable 3',5'-cyclic phosphodiesterase pde-5 isoform X3 n=1 Tax=Tigriopus californicus TaxID=6832 RepID=UPI0027DA3FB7|nr:probable 3',5'-cyclic phosphodiesterase pde-5 isoform X3 [Tigriopus californicus]